MEISTPSSQMVHRRFLPLQPPRLYPPLDPPTGLLEQQQHRCGEGKVSILRLSGHGAWDIGPRSRVLGVLAVDQRYSVPTQEDHAGLRERG